VTLRSGRSEISASAIAPEPVPTSWTREPSGSLAEGGAAEDVGHRLAVDPAGDARLDRRGDLGVDFPGAVDRQFPGLHAQRVGDQRFGIGAGVLDAGRRDPLGGIVKHGADGPGRGSLLTLNVYCRHCLPFLSKFAPKILRKINTDSRLSSGSLNRFVRRRPADASVTADHDSDPDRSAEDHRQALPLGRGQSQRPGVVAAQELD
jgi:hypothetical protein